MSLSSLDVKAKTAISPAAVTSSSLDPLTVEQLRSNMQVIFILLTRVVRIRADDTSVYKQ